MMEGVCISAFAKQKDEYILEGNDRTREQFSLSAALNQQSTTVKRKDIRKFLNFIYDSEKTTSQL